MRVGQSAAALVAWGWLGLASALAARAESVHDARGQARILYSQGRYAEALPLFDRVLKAKPHDIDSLNKRGCIYLRMNQPARALPDFSKAVQYSPFLDIDAQQLGRQTHPDVPGALTAPPYWSPQFYPSAFTNRGIALMMLGRDGEAAADFHHSIDLHRAYPLGAGNRFGLASAYGGLGQALHNQGDDAEALEAFDQAIRSNPQDPNGYVGRGLALAGLGRLDEAVGSHNAALRLVPNHSRALGGRGSALQLLGRDADALADYNAALRVDPSSTTVLRLRGALQSRLGRHEAALGDFTEAIRLAPNDAAAYKDRGGVYNRLGDNAKALQDLDQAVRLDPKSSKAFQNRAATFNGMARYDLALRDADEAVRLDPKNAGARNNRGLAEIGLGRYEEAVVDLDQSIHLDPNLVAGYFNRAGAYTRLGLLDRASADYQEVLRREPKLVQAEAGLGQVRALSRLRARSSPVDLSVSADPIEARRYREEGIAHRASGDWRGAVAAFSKAIEADPEDAESHALRGWSRLCGGASGAEADARVWLDRKGWRDPFAPYMALLGVIAARQAGHAELANGFLAEALANTRPPGWPAPVFRFLRRTIPSTDLLAAANGPDQQTEAETIVGLDLLSRGERAAAVEHLRWVRDHGLDRSIAHDLAAETLRRIDASATP